jgi:outer membrane protein OmpA-like peptidoglycan-associated protein
MRTQLLLAASLVCIVSVLSLSTPTAWARCSDAINQQAHQAYQKKDAKALLALVEQCDSDYPRELAGRVLYDSTAKLTGTALLEGLKKVLEIAPNPSKPRWKANIEMGKIAEKAGSFKTAFFHYETALDTLNSPNLSADDGAPAEVFLAIRKDAERVRLLADTFIASTRGRDDKLSGVAQIRYRGSCVTQSIIPIHFETKQATLTADGERYAAEMGEMLKNNQYPDIEIIGHADERGTESDNMALSIQRAETLSHYLKQQGHTGQITIDGKGEAVHYDDANYASYSKDEQLRLNRRVEFNFNGKCENRP